MTALFWKKVGLDLARTLISSAAVIGTQLAYDPHPDWGNYRVAVTAALVVAGSGVLRALQALLTTFETPPPLLPSPVKPGSTA